MQGGSGAREWGLECFKFTENYTKTIQFQSAIAQAES
ncbi:hypothetical protein LYNGBM3L_00230 [Moorena producens 3L]|uniref:Uncharacterized protein n=1 Tax=Moorena producens 3L TaxID=489825 RepID=F4XI40_9CYAN|nr:hypothetical protein LYNGBM3L_00230 [Moorena producens 3L]